MAVLLILGAAGYVWFINTPMYLGYELYVSYVNRHHLSPGHGFHKAYQATLSGNRKGVKALIRNSSYWEKDYRTYADTLRNILSDSTDTIKSAHFRKDGSIRITDDQRMLTLEDAYSHSSVLQEAYGNSSRLRLPIPLRLALLQVWSDRLRCCT